MSNTKPNQPAFASTDAKTFANYGLTKREYFASMTLQGLLADGHYTSSAAKRAVDLADELIKALNEGGDNE